MAFWTRFLYKRQKEKELESEINAHPAVEAQQPIERESAQEAHLNAVRDLRNWPLVKKVTRSGSRWTWGERLQQDLRYSLRALL